MLTLAMLRQAAATMKANNLPVHSVSTQEQADRLNAQSRAIGSSYEWKLGDGYYELERIGGGTSNLNA